MDHIADLLAGQVHGDVVRNITSGDFQFHFRAHNGQGAATLQTGRGFVVHELDMDEQLDLRVVMDAQEVDMRRQILDHVALHTAADDMHVLMTLNLEVQQRLQEAALLEALEQIVVADVQSDRFFTVAINDCGYVALTTSLTSGPLACPRPYRGDEILSFTSHGSLLDKSAILQGCMARPWAYSGESALGKAQNPPPPQKPRNHQKRRGQGIACRQKTRRTCVARVAQGQS